MNHPARLPGLLLSLVLCLVCARALAQEARTATDPQFSARGRTLVGGSLSGYWTTPQSGGKDWTVSLEPAVAHFFWDRIGVGLRPGYSTGNETFGYSTVRFQDLSLAAFAIYDLPLAERIGLLILPSIGYAHRWHDGRLPPFDLTPLSTQDLVVRGPDGRENILRVALHLPMVYRPAPNVVLGLGPFFQLDRVHLHASAPIVVGGQTVRSPFASHTNYFNIGVATYIAASF